MSKKKPQAPKIDVREKGAEFERKIAKLIGNWWEEEFHRVPRSGGCHWREDHRVSGDLVAPPMSIFPFGVECKKQEDWIIDQLLIGTGKVESWWTQCIRDASQYSRKPFLIFAKNYMPILFMMQHSDFIPLSEAEYFKANGMMPLLTLDIPGKPKRVVGMLEKLISAVSKSEIIRLYGLVVTPSVDRKSIKIDLDIFSHK